MLKKRRQRRETPREEGRGGGVSKSPQSPRRDGRREEHDVKEGSDPASETDKHRHGSLNLILVVC